MRYVVDKLTTNNDFVGELVNIYLCGLNDKSYKILYEGIVGMNTDEVFDFIEEFIHYNEFVYEPKNETRWQEEYEITEENETTEAYDFLENESHTQPPESQKYKEIKDSFQILNTDALEEPHVSLPQSDFGEVIMEELSLEEEFMEPGDVMSRRVSQEQVLCPLPVIVVDSREDEYQLTHPEQNKLLLISRKPVVEEIDLKICSSFLGKACDVSYDDTTLAKYILQDLEDKVSIDLECGVGNWSDEED